MGLAWGGFRNGSIPQSSLHSAPNFSTAGSGYASVGAGSALMRTDAAIQLSGMMRDFYSTFKIALRLSEGYRSVGVQNLYWDRYIHRKPGWTIAATPGTSIHGWGLSADLNVNGGNPSGVHLQWLRNNAAKYGFVNDVATEPWHWSYRTDLVTRSIAIGTYIDNPQATAASANSKTPTKNKNLENDMPRLVRISQPGSPQNGGVFLIFPDRLMPLGSEQQVYNMGRAWGIIPPSEVSRALTFAENISLTEFQAAKDEIELNRVVLVNKIVEQVWAGSIDGHPAWSYLINDAASQGTLTEEAQKKLVAAVIDALPAQSGSAPATGGAAPSGISVEDLSKALVKALTSDLADRLK